MTDRIRRCNRCLARFLCLGHNNHIYCLPCVHQYFSQNKPCPSDAVRSVQESLSAEGRQPEDSPVVAVCLCEDDVETKLGGFKSMTNISTRDPKTVDISLLK